MKLWLETVILFLVSTSWILSSQKLTWSRSAHRHVLKSCPSCSSTYNCWECDEVWCILCYTTQQFWDTTSHIRLWMTQSREQLRDDALPGSCWCSSQSRFQYSLQFQSMFDNQPQQTQSSSDGCAIVLHSTSYSLQDIRIKKNKTQITQLAAHIFSPNTTHINLIIIQFYCSSNRKIQNLCSHSKMYR